MIIDGGGSPNAPSPISLASGVAFDVAFGVVWRIVYVSLFYVVLGVLFYAAFSMSLSLSLSVLPSGCTSNNKRASFSIHSGIIPD